MRSIAVAACLIVIATCVWIIMVLPSPFLMDRSAGFIIMAIFTILIGFVIGAAALIIHLLTD